MGNTKGSFGDRSFSGVPEPYIISAGESRNLLFWDPNERAVKYQISNAHDHTICDVVEMGDSRHILSSSFDSKIKVWDVKSMKNVNTFVGHKDAVRKLCVWGELCLSASKDNTVKIWDMKTGKCKDTYTAYCNGASDIKTVGPNTIATTNNTTIRLWDVNKKKLIQSYTTHFDWVIALEHDERKNLLYSASWDKTIRLWDTRVRSLLAKPLATVLNTHQINSMLFAPAKDWVLVGDQAGNISVYDMRKVQRVGKGKKPKFGAIEVDQPIIRDQPHSEVVFKLCWLDEHRFASCAADKTIRIYDLTKLTSTGFIMRDSDPISTIMYFRDHGHHVDNFVKLEMLKRMKRKIKKGEAKALQNLKDQEGGMRNTL